MHIDMRSHLRVVARQRISRQYVIDGERNRKGFIFESR